MTRREFAILEYFLHHPDEVLSKRDILDHVWDFDFDGDPNIVEVYVRRLRTKAPRPGDGPLIETVRGAGYRLVGGHARPRQQPPCAPNHRLALPKAAYI